MNFISDNWHVAPRGYEAFHTDCAGRFKCHRCNWILGMEESACRYGGWMWIYWISSCGQPSKGGPPSCGLGKEFITRRIYKMLGFVTLSLIKSVVLLDYFSY